MQLPQIPADKWAHFSGCAFLVMFIARSIETALPPMLAHSSIFLGFAGSIAAGVAKEAWDSRPGGTGFSWYDLSASSLGALAGSAAWTLSGIV